MSVHCLTIAGRRVREGESAEERNTVHGCHKKNKTLCFIHKKKKTPNIILMNENNMLVLAADKLAC